jgi:hypothetical protein
MAKRAKVKTVVVKCQCSTCEQVAFVEAGKPHVYCKGLPQRIIDKMPATMRGITNPNRKGTWVEFVSPKEQAA